MVPDIAAVSFANSSPSKRQQRAAWWKSLVGKAFNKDGNPLFDHPAILAAVRAIDEVTSAGEKVLVFGRFTLPLQALESVLNAQAMLRALDAGALWPQASVHENEWEAIQAAHRQLKRPGELDKTELNTKLALQYVELEKRRRASRGALVQLLDTGLARSGRARELFEAFKRSVDGHSGGAESPLVLVAKAMHELSDLEMDERSPEVLANAFEELIDALLDRDEGNGDGDGKLDDIEAMKLWRQLHDKLNEEYNRREGGFARLLIGGTKPETRRLLQLAFNRPRSNPQVLVAQSVVGREGLNLHKACKTVVLLHPEWNPGVVEQQIGRVDRVGSLWENALTATLENGHLPLPRIVVRPVIFGGTYDEKNWEVLRERWDDLRAQLHGVVISPRLAVATGLSEQMVQEINEWAPTFSNSQATPDA